MSAPALLALDLAGNVGFARLRRGQVPTFGTLKLEGPDLTYKAGQVLEWLHDEYDREPFDGVCWEGPIMTPTDTVDLIKLLVGLVAVVHAFVGSLRIRGIHLAWCEVSVDDAKKALCGNLWTNDPKTDKRRKVNKDDMLHAARTTMNWRVVTDHEADAGAVGLVGYARLWPKVRP